MTTDSSIRPSGLPPELWTNEKSCKYLVQTLSEPFTDQDAITKVLSVYGVCDRLMYVEGDGFALFSEELDQELPRN